LVRLTKSAAEERAQARSSKSESCEKDNGDNTRHPPEHAREAIVPFHYCPGPGSECGGNMVFLGAIRPIKSKENGCAYCRACWRGSLVRDGS
jgi:hypothetical protein